MSITRTSRVEQLAEGDRLSSVHIVFYVSLSISQPGKITVVADTRPVLDSP